MTNLSKLQSEAVKQKPKELDWEKELIDRLVKDLLIESGIDWAFEDYKRIYDLVNPVIQSLLTQQRTELLEEITDILDNIDTGMYVDDKWVSNSEELTELRKNINSLNKKDE